MRRWFKQLATELIDVVCGNRKGLVMLAQDVDDILRPGEELRSYPACLLPAYDNQLMTHKDKSWIAPHEEERSRRSQTLSFILKHPSDDVGDGLKTQKSFPHAPSSSGPEHLYIGKPTSLARHQQ